MGMVTLMPSGSSSGAFKSPNSSVTSAVQVPDGLNPAVRVPLHLEIQQALGIHVQGHAGGVGAGVQENPDHVPLVVIDPALFGDSGGLVFLDLFGLQLFFQGF